MSIQRQPRAPDVGALPWQIFLRPPRGSSSRLSWQVLVLGDGDLSFSPRLEMQGQGTEAPPFVASR